MAISPPSDGTDSDEASAHNGPDDDGIEPDETTDTPGGDGRDGQTRHRESTDAGRPRLLEEAGWLRWYLHEQSIHVAVILALAVYPAVYHIAITSPLSSEAEMLLPQMQTMVPVLFFGLFAMSFDLISGYTGYLSFGHAAFYGAGAYFVVLVANEKVPVLPSDTPFMILLLLAGLLAVGLALLVGVVSFRLTGVYFAMITLGFAQVGYVLMRGWDYVGSNPRDGVSVNFSIHPDGFAVGVPWVDPLNLALGRLTGDELELFGIIALGETAVSYYMVGLVVVGCYFAMQRIIHSPFGRVMIAIRENEERARAVGYETFRYKLAAFSMSAFFAGVAGGLLAGYSRSVTPEGTFFFLVTGDALLAAILGGFGTLAGPLYGHLFDEVAREFLSKASSGGGLLPYLREHLGDATLGVELYNGLTIGEGIEVFLNGHGALYVGILFVLFVLYVPGGLLGTIRARLGGPVAKRLPPRARAKIRAYLKGLRP